MGFWSLEKRNGLNLRLLLSLAVFLAIVFGSYTLSQSNLDFDRFAALGYFGVFLATMLGSATLFFPVPNVATVFAAGALFNPVGVAIFGGLGATVGEAAGYLIGVSSEESIKDRKWYPAVEQYVTRYGGWAIFLLALIPNPFFDLAGLVAGMMHYSIKKFFLSTLAGKVIRSFVLAYIGSAI